MKKKFIKISKKIRFNIIKKLLYFDFLKKIIYKFHKKKIKQDDLYTTPISSTGVPVGSWKMLPMHNHPLAGNSGFGYQALNVNVSGFYNSAIGNNPLFNYKELEQLREENRKLKKILKLKSIVEV